jgi:hypothetical protein
MAKKFLNPKRAGLVGGAFAVGVARKHLPVSLPELPVLGAMGTIGVAAYFVSDDGRNELADDVCTAAFVLAAYELGKSGSIIGGDDDYYP